MALPSFKDIGLDSLVAFGAKVVSVGLVLTTQLLLAQLYGPELMGTFFIALNIVMTLSVVCRLGLDLGLLRFAAVLKSDGRVYALKKLLWPATMMTLPLACGVVVLIYLSRAWLAAYFNAPLLPSMLTLFAWAVPCYVATFLLQETLRGLGAVRWTVLGQYVIIPGSLLALLIILAYFSIGIAKKAQALGLAFLVSTILGLAFFGWHILFCTCAEKVSKTRESFINLVRYSWPLFCNTILLLALMTLDSLILGAFTSPQEVAYYGAATKTALLVTFPLLAINAVVPSLFGQFYHQQNLASLENVAKITARWMYLGALPLALLIILLAPQLLAFYGPEFVKARFVLSILALAQLINVAGGSVGYILIMTAHQHVLLRMQLLVTCFILPLMILGAAFWGLNGVACATALGLIGNNILMAWAVWRHLKIKAFVRGTGWINLSGLLAALLFLMLKPPIGLVAALIAFIIAYLLLVLDTLRREFEGVKLLSIRLHGGNTS